MESEHFISSVFAFDDDGVEAHTCTLLECAVSSGLHEAARADVAKTSPILPFRDNVFTKLYVGAVV